MVQQLSLTAQVPSGKVQRLLLTLQALTGNIQHSMHQHTVILRPRYPFIPEIIPGKVVQIESYRVRMNRIWEDGYPSKFEHSTIAGDEILGESITKPNENINDSIWTLQLSDIPAGGKNLALIQNIYETTIYQTDDVIGYLDELGYMHETEFWTNGVRFYYGNAIIELTKLYVLDKKNNAETIEDVDMKDVDHNKSDAIKNDLSNLKLLDPSETCHLKAYVNIGALNDLENVNLGLRQLESLQRELSEIIQLHIPDRTTMDSRINSRIANTGSKRV